MHRDVPLGKTSKHTIANGLPYMYLGLVLLLELLPHLGPGSNCAEMFGIIKCAEAIPHTRRPERRKEGERIAGANDDKR